MEPDSTSTEFPGRTTDGSSSVRGASTGGHARSGHAPAMVLASARIAAVGTYAGINLFLPSVAGLGMDWFASRAMKLRDPLIVRPPKAVLKDDCCMDMLARACIPPVVCTSCNFATWHRQAGTPTHELQRLGGWKTGAMVERYAHVAPEALQGAANRLDAFGGYVPATPKRPTA